MDRSPEDILRDVKRWAKDYAETYGQEVYLPMSNTLKQEAIIEQPSRKIAKAPTQAITSAEDIFEIKLAVHAGEPWAQAKTLDELKQLTSGCTKCELHKTRKNYVFGVGNPNAGVMVIGEAPGADEDTKGEPFVGRAGQLLDKMLLAIGFPREEVFIANILKSRPPGNRDPLPIEVEACEPYLWKQIELIRPKMILCMGRIAGTNLLKNGIDTLAKMRGSIYDYMGAKVMVTYHPAALLRNPNWKAPAWEDLQKFRRLYDEIVGDKPKFDPKQAATS
jgi:DNA polymerase